VRAVAASRSPTTIWASETLAGVAPQYPAPDVKPWRDAQPVGGHRNLPTGGHLPLPIDGHLNARSDPVPRHTASNFVDAFGFDIAESENSLTLRCPGRVSRWLLPHRD
jgi:hypothetical protein